MSKKKNIPGSWSYCAFIDSPELDALKILVVNFGTQSKEKSRTKQHKNNCAKCEYPLNYNTYYGRYDRVFGNKIISKNHDSEFVLRVGKKLDSDAYLLNKALRYIRNLFLEADLSETECIVIHYTNKEDCIKNLKTAIEEVNNEWYYTDESLRVDIKASNNESYDIDMKVRPFLVNRKTRRFIASHINSYKQYDKVLVQGLTAANYIYTKFDNINSIVVYISPYDIYHNKAIYNEFKKLDNIEFKYYNSDKEIEDLYMNEKINDFDIIITNPPYGRIGVTITDLINKKRKKDSEFINLLPINDYCIYAGYKNLYQYIDSTEVIRDSFDDAAVIPCISKLTKVLNFQKSEAEFKILTYTDRDLDHYFSHLLEISYLPIDNAARKTFSSITTENPDNTIIIGIRDINHKHLAYTYDCDTYKWNVEKSITVEDLKANIGKTGSPNPQSSHYWITFNTAAEKDNFSNFMYSKNGFRFLSKVFTAVNVTSMIPLGRILPKVDWSKPWTVEEILAEYNYTEEEIKKIMASLDNFKYMDK